MEVNNVIISDSKGKAEAFNDFFLSHASIDTSNAKLPEDSNFEIRLDSIIASEQEVLDLIKSLDTTKATGPDGIGPRLLYEAVYTIVPLLRHILSPLHNLSPTTKCAPLTAHFVAPCTHCRLKATKCVAVHSTFCRP